MTKLLVMVVCVFAGEWLKSGCIRAGGGAGDANARFGGTL